MRYTELRMGLRVANLMCGLFRHEGRLRVSLNFVRCCSCDDRPCPCRSMQDIDVSSSEDSGLGSHQKSLTKGPTRTINSEQGFGTLFPSTPSPSKISSAGHENLRVVSDWRAVLERSAQKEGRPLEMGNRSWLCV